MVVHQVRLGDVLELQRRRVALDAAEEYVEVGLRSFGKGVFHKPAATSAQLGSKKVYRIEPGDLVISNVFAWEGALAVASECERGLIGSHRFMTWTPRRANQVDVRYLWHYFLSEPGLSQLRTASPGSAGRNRTLSISALENIVIGLPELSEQQRVAAHLDRLAAMRPFPSTTEQLDLSIHALLREGPDAPLAAALDLELDDFPVDREAVYERAGVLSFGRGLFTHGLMPGSQTKYAKLRYVHTGQLVMSRLKAFEGAVAIATPGFEGSVVSQEFVTFTPKAGVDPDWVDSLCRWPRFWEALRATSTGIGARRERVSADALLSLRIPYPDAESQRRIAALNRSRLRVAGFEAEREHLRAAILPAARNKAFAKLT
ncbi:restriction endonuclease subunit S [Terrabacter sp. Root181]|uniref:restriction endonuclease subunit S n=1 Tax=Terrabacter sp. Root181 TaxID=1736484 RepID=UPI0006F514ED|nr:restriction endonuclease subunit S [Terrabacter sp. Root181]KRB47906.1 hypothetical protein ASD90_06280 [Terrabacter sp. Root181]